MTLHSVSIPDSLYERLLQQAETTNRPIEEIVQYTLDRHLPPQAAPEKQLSPLLQAELEAMERLSDSALWAIAGSQLPPAQRDQLEELNYQAKIRPLSEEEQDRQDLLLESYDEIVLRRAHAALLLRSRGYDISDPSIFARP